MKSIFVFLILVFAGLSFDRLNIFKYCIAASVLHECGHIAAYRFATGTMPEIKISVFGFRMKNNVSLNKKYSLILFSGPLANLTAAIISRIINLFSFHIHLYIFSIVNSVLFVFNMLPVFFLDGGQILYAESAFYRKNYRIISMFSVLFIAVMAFSFTDNIASLMLFIMYFTFIILNDV